MNSNEFLEAMRTYESRIFDVICYCNKHSEQTWAVFVASMLLDCDDFRDAPAVMRDYIKSYERMNEILP
jgi:hypothetical protein